MGCQLVCSVRWNGLWVVVWFHILFGAVVAMYHVNDVFGVIGLVSPVELNVYEVCPSDMYLQERQFFRMGMSPGAGYVVWDCEVWPELKIAEVTTTSISYNGCSFKDVIATGEWNKDMTVFANNGSDGTKGCDVGDNEGNTFCFVQCGSVMGSKC